MAKKNKVVQMQSPENYIRTRARNLEIFECLYDNDWKESGVVNIVVAQPCRRQDRQRHAVHRC